MSVRPLPLRRRRAAEPPTLDGMGVAGAAPFPVIVIDDEDRIVDVNDAAQHLLGASAAALAGAPLDRPFRASLHGLIEQCREHAVSAADHDLRVDHARGEIAIASARATPLADHPRWVALYLFERPRADAMGQRVLHRNAARSATGMAMMLAHEVKNPLSGIRGAAQLLEQTLNDGDRELAALIREEADRIGKLLAQMDAFAEAPTLSARGPVNVHSVLERVRRIAENGFASHVRFVENYDPSLPPVFGDQDRLIQAVLNLVKNAAEAAPAHGGEIQLSTTFSPGVRIRAPGSARPTRLPLVIGVRDNGSGVPEALRDTLFDAFVSGKPSGKGLGLALVSKVVEEHGGVVDFESAPRRTTFRLRLPLWETQA